MAHMVARGPRPTFDRTRRHAGAGGGSKTVQHIQLKTSDLFDQESPKAYAPLGYTITIPRCRRIKPEDFPNETPLPVYAKRHPVKLIRPLGATFVDTEIQRPGLDISNMPRRPLLRRDGSDGQADPISVIIEANRSSRRAVLTLGGVELTESSLEAKKRKYMERLQVKRERESSVSETEEGGSTREVKKQRKIIGIKFDGEDEPDVNDNTVKPENVLRMVDSSLVDTPEKPSQRDPLPISHSVRYGAQTQPTYDSYGGSTYPSRTPVRRPSRDGSRDSRVYGYRPDAPANHRDRYSPPPRDYPSSYGSGYRDYREEPSDPYMPSTRAPAHYPDYEGGYSGGYDRYRDQPGAPPREYRRERDPRDREPVDPRYFEERPSYRRGDYRDPYRDNRETHDTRYQGQRDPRDSYPNREYRRFDEGRR